MLKKSVIYDEKLLNWNRINATICFNYFQQAFYLVSPTMKSLAKGNNQVAIGKLLRVLIQTSTGIKQMDDDVDMDGIEDVADVLCHEGGMDGGKMAREGAMVMSHDPLEESKDHL